MTSDRLSNEEVDAAFELANETASKTVPGGTEPERRAAISEKVRENRLRRMAERQGFTLTKSRRRDPRARDFGLYWLAEASTNALQTAEHGSTLDEIESYLTR